MTEREKRNEEMKERIRREAEAQCNYIDLMEQETQQRERMLKTLAEQLDQELKKDAA